MTSCGARGSPVYVFSMTSVCCRGRSLTVFLYCSQGINDTAAPVTNSISIFFPFTIVSTEISEYLLYWGKEYSLNSQSVSDLVCSHSLSFSLASTWWILLFLSFALCLIALPFCSDFSTFGFLSLSWLLLALLLHMRLVLPFLPHWWKSAVIISVICFPAAAAFVVSLCKHRVHFERAAWNSHQNAMWMHVSNLCGKA